MLHLGILAHSVEGAALCFRTFGQEGSRRMGPHHHPDVTVDCIAMGASMDAWEQGDLTSIRQTLASSVQRLASAGADFFVCPDNTAHLALESPGATLALPGLHIADVVAVAAAEAGFSRVGVLGTAWTMSGPIYPRAMQRHGIDTLVPDPDARRELDRIIFDELVEGAFTDESRGFYLDVITDLASSGCDAVALVCTEIPLLVTEGVSPLPTLDSTRLLARAACDVAVEQVGLPSWRGGPPPPASG